MNVSHAITMTHAIRFCQVQNETVNYSRIKRTVNRTFFFKSDDSTEELTTYWTGVRRGGGDRGGRMLLADIRIGMSPLLFCFICL